MFNRDKPKDPTPDEAADAETPIVSEPTVDDHGVPFVYKSEMYHDKDFWIHMEWAAQQLAQAAGNIYTAIQNQDMERYSVYSKKAEEDVKGLLYAEWAWFEVAVQHGLVEDDPDFRKRMQNKMTADLVSQQVQEAGITEGSGTTLLSDGRAAHFVEVTPDQLAALGIDVSKIPGYVAPGTVDAKDDDKPGMYL